MKSRWNDRELIVYRDCVGTCRRCGKHELVEDSALCESCLESMVAGLPSSQVPQVALKKGA